MVEPVKFLLVDDLPENLLSLEALLRRDGLTLLTAASGDQALELLLQHEVALALLDVQMPGLNGFELAELMRGNERTRRIPIIFLTAGSGDNRRRFRGYEAGAVDFIQKPIEPDILRGKTEVFYDLYRQRQQIAEQRDALEKQAELLREAGRHKDVLINEINHRIKNLFTVTAGLITLSARSAGSANELAEDLRERLWALSRSHDLTMPDLSGSGGASQPSTTFVALLEAILSPHRTDEDNRIVISGPDAPLSGAALTSLALLLHELATNAAKYGALSSAEGRLSIEIVVAGDKLEMLWDERSALTLPERTGREGFGTTLEKVALGGLGAALTRTWRPDGLSVQFRMPLAT